MLNFVKIIKKLKENKLNKKGIKLDKFLYLKDNLRILVRDIFILKNFIKSVNARRGLMDAKTISLYFFELKK